MEGTKDVRRARKIVEAGRDAERAEDAIKGGKYKDVRKANKGGEVHHIPSDSVNPKPKGEGTCIWTETPDHKQTSSYGRGKEAQEYRSQEKKLIDAGKTDDAVIMGIEDVQSKFGNKYDEALEQMIDELD